MGFCLAKGHGDYSKDVPPNILKALQQMLLRPKVFLEVNTEKIQQDKIQIGPTITAIGVRWRRLLSQN